MCQRDGLHARVAFYVHVMWDSKELLRERSGARCRPLLPYLPALTTGCHPLLFAQLPPGNPTTPDFVSVHMLLAIFLEIRNCFKRYLCTW